MLARRTTVPLSLLRHHGPMIRGTGRILWQALRPQAAPDPERAVAAVTRTIPAPPGQLLQHYLDWAGASGRYADTLPPHMVSQWGMAAAGELLLQAGYPVLRILNQGISLQVHGPLPRGQALQVRAAIQSQQEVDGKMRLALAIETGTEQQPRLLDTVLHLALIQPGPRVKAARRSEPDDQVWCLAGKWQASAHDGLKFALLTGDFNPLHWLAPLARRSVFGGKVLHGFGTLVRSMETLEVGSLREIDVRFVRPVPLPSTTLKLEHGAPDAAGWRALRLVGGGKLVHLAGRYR